MENISCLDNVVEFILRTENFSPDDIDDALLFDNCTGQTIGSKKFTNSDTYKNEFNNMTKAVKESVPYEDVLLYSADRLSVPSFSSNYKKMDQGQQINQEPFDPTDLFEFSDEEFRQMINLRDSFEVQEEVVTEECPEQGIYIQSLDMNYSTDFDTILETEVEYMSSTVDVDIPIPEGEGASYDLSRFNQKSHVINHMLTNNTDHSFCCVLCSNRYHQKCDSTKHMKIQIDPNNVSDSSQFTVPIHSLSVTNGKGSENKGDIYQEPNTKKGNGRRKSRNKIKDPLMALKLYSKPHTCNPCGVSFTYKNVLLKHARLRHNHDGVNIACTQNSNSDTYELTILANSKFNNVSSYFCDSCEAVYNRFDFFKRHQRWHINIELGNIEEETNKCIDSGLLLNSLPELEMHTKQHLTVTSFPKKSKCSVCDRKFGVTDEVSDLDRSQLHSDSLTEYICRLCRNLSNDDKVLQKDLIIHDTSNDNVNKNDKEVTCDILDEEVADKQALINHKASHVNTISVSQNSSTIKMFPCDSCDKVGTCKDQRHSKLGNQKITCCLVPNAIAGQFDTEQVSPGSKYTDLKSELIPKMQCFVLKDGECARTCSTALYYYSRSYSNVMNSSLSEDINSNRYLNI
ncbi:zinc finger protein 436-like [Metopolophium dirhodum]|uniref:zinc finger protein 436-like n=1 Tax=Metopolophium dirhodum TaxID=44670 RepID=UPI00298F500F|nr:zinc finger protein 436-like [Metopolophium dirhodum]